MTVPATRTVHRSRLPRVLAERLEREILEGRLRPHERLASERSLSTQFGVSRPVLRDALRILQERRLVTTRRGRGTYVRDFLDELAQVPPRTWLLEQRALVTEFYEARLLIEPEGAARAATRRSEKQLTELERIVASAERLAPDSPLAVFTGLDIDFHTCIVEMSGSGSLRKMLAAIIVPHADLRHVIHRVPGHPEVAHARHARILRAIESRAPEEARDAMRRALAGTLRDIEQLLKGGDSPPDALP